MEAPAFLIQATSNQGEMLLKCFQRYCHDGVSR